MMHSPFKYRSALEDHLAFAHIQDVYVKVPTVIAVIVLAIGLGIAAKGALPGKSAMAGPASEFEPHTHVIREPSRLETCVSAMRSNRTC